MSNTVLIHKTLEEMGHPQPPMHIVTDNTTAVGLAKKIVKQRRSKAVDMRLYWVQDRILQQQFLVYWRKGAEILSTTRPIISQQGIILPKYLTTFK